MFDLKFLMFNDAAKWSYIELELCYLNQYFDFNQYFSVAFIVKVFHFNYYFMLL